MASPPRDAVASAVMDIRIQCVVVDAGDPERLARFWSEAIGWRITYESDDEWAVEPPEGSPATMWRPTSCS